MGGLDLILIDPTGGEVRRDEEVKLNGSKPDSPFSILENIRGPRGV
jgi:hypothetical protein